jgi:hypothetical protein
MSHVPGCEVSVLSGVLAERGKHDAVLKLEASDLEWGEDFGDLGAMGLRIGSCA